MKKNISLVFLITFICFGYSQKKSISKANSNFEKFKYINAIKTYENVAKKGYKSVELFSKLGDSYYFQSNFVEANKWYEQLFELSNELNAEYYYRYSQTLKSLKNYKKASEMMDIFNKLNGSDLRAKLANDQKNFLEEIDKNSGRFTIKNAEINSKYSDYGTTFYKNTIVFTSARDTGGFFTKKHKWNNQSFTKLYSSTMKLNGNIEKPKSFSSKIDTRYHESTPVFTKDGNTMYFTRNNFLNGKKGKDDKNVILLKLYKATKTGNTWNNIVELPFNNDNYSCAHPALSLDEKYLYFSSDMPGTVGLSDIFKVEILENNKFGTPKNLGGKINTEGRETFPFVTDKDELYFASDGHPGLGGLDVFYTQLKKDDTHTKIKNIGTPVNSSFDDFAYIINNETSTGFLTSNRPEDNLGYDDIFKVNQLSPLPPDCQQILTGAIVDRDTELPLTNAKVTLFDSNYQKIKEIITTEDGDFNFGAVDCNSKFRILAENKRYSSNEFSIIIPNDSGVTDTIINLTPLLQPLKVGDDLRKALGIDIIYFDLNKSNIRQDASVELAKIVDVMNQYPTLEIEVRSHTDSRQTVKYNLNLSERRANSTIKWLIDKGIDSSRIIGKGYGESKLINKCADNVKCSEKEHQANRRSEFIITKI